MFEGWFIQNVKSVDEIMPYPPYPTYAAGTNFKDKGHVKYSLKSSVYPNLIIIDPIFDHLGNHIPSGHYELALADDRTFLILLEGKQPLAVIPVFKLEEDEQEVQKFQSKKYQKKLKKEAKKKAKKDAKLARSGVKPEEKTIDMKASIEYVKNGQYYLIKYEKGIVRAWGAIKE